MSFGAFWLDAASTCVLNVSKACRNSGDNDSAASPIRFRPERSSEMLPDTCPTPLRRFSAASCTMAKPSAASLPKPSASSCRSMYATLNLPSAFSALMDSSMLFDMASAMLASLSMTMDDADTAFPKAFVKDEPNPISTFFTPTSAVPMNGMREANLSFVATMRLKTVVPMVPTVLRMSPRLDSRLTFCELTLIRFVNGARNRSICCGLKALLTAGASWPMNVAASVLAAFVNGMNPLSISPMVSAMPVLEMAVSALPKLAEMAVAASLERTPSVFLMLFHARSAVTGMAANCFSMASAFSSTVSYRAWPLILPSLPNCFSSPTDTLRCLASIRAICGEFSMMEFNSSPFTMPLPNACVIWRMALDAS